MDNQEYVDFKKIKEYIQIKDVSNFLEYLQSLFKDLSSRYEVTKAKGIQKVSFLDYIKLPIFIGEKLFRAFDIDADGFLNLKEFTKGMKNLYLGTFEETIQIVFSILDFDQDGFVTKGDVKLLLSYLPIKTDKKKIVYLYQMESLAEIDTIVKSTFSSFEKLSLTEFIKAVEKKMSDVYLQILCFLYQKKPFNEELIEKFRGTTKKNIVDLKEIAIENSPPIASKRLPSPRKKSILAPAISFFSLDNDSNTANNNLINIKALNSNEDIQEKDIAKSNETHLASGIKGMRRMPNEKIPQTQAKSKELIKESKNIFNSPSKYLKKKEMKVSEFSLESNLISMGSNNEDSSPKNKNSTQSPKKNKETAEEITYEGYLTKIDKKKALKTYYAVLIDKDIYYYQSNTKEKLIKIKNLSACFVKEAKERKIEGVQYHCFQLKFAKTKKVLFHKEKAQIVKWCEKIREAIGYLNFFDYYEMLDEIGEGKFGLVKIGVHKKTNERVAIKIIKKEVMKDRDIELVKNEIDIMKLCHHHNIVRLLDHFENSEYIFIVMDYFRGGDLEEYFKKMKFEFTEEKAANMILQLCNGIKYLQDFGIIHRDLKPGNIMLSDTTDKAVVKIMDFGLSKIVGPQERLEDGFGTLTFVAPEVLLRTPYNKQIDIWSIGVILFYMLSGSLPFDDSTDNEEVIAQKIVFDELQFPPKQWNKKSKEVKDFIFLCLEKNPDNRIQIDKLMEHQWLKLKLK